MSSNLSERVTWEYEKRRGRLGDVLIKEAGDEREQDQARKQEGREFISTAGARPG